jgi:ATP-dependent RNA helicase DHX37/DHR1
MFFSQTSSYDSSNAFALPSAKRKLIRTKTAKDPVKILSKKQRKKLEKVVDRKKKKAERSELIEKLVSVQASQTDLWYKCLLMFCPVSKRKYCDNLS